MLKKLLPIVVLFTMITGLMPMTAFAARGVSVNTLVTSDTTPQLTGTIAGGDGTERVSVTVGGHLYSATNATTGWTADVTDPLADGVYDVVVNVVNALSGTVTDLSTDELTIDATAPVVTVDTLTTSDTKPALTGTVTDSTATMVITVNGVAYSNFVHGTGTITISGNTSPYTWTLGNDEILTALTVGTYNVIATATDPVGNVGTDTTTEELTVTGTSNLTIGTFTATPATGFDPSPSGQNEDLTINYSIVETGASVDVAIKNSFGVEVKTFSSVEQSTSFVWNGEYNGKLAEPGTYKAVLEASKTGYTTTTQEKTFVVAYDDTDKPTISGFIVDPDSFNPADEDTVIEFKNDVSAFLTVEIRKTTGELVRSFNNYENDEFTSDDTHSITWNGEDDSNDLVSTGTYKAIVVARNEYGVAVYQEDVAVTSSGSGNSSSNAHISGVNFDPSSKFEPAEDDEMVIEYDVLQELDSLKINAVRGTESIELADDTNISKESNLEVTWDGTNDNGDYAASGTWKIEFTSKVGATTLTAVKTIEISYAKANIDDLYVSKDKFDNDLGEFTYVMFRVDEDALVDINILESGDEDDTLTEDMEVVKNKWYAVQFDGGSYDYDNDIDLEVVAKNKANEEIYTTKKIGVDLAEDDVSSSKSNVTNDFISPVLTTGNGEMELSYDIDEDADITVTIHKGKSSTGTKMIELQDVEDQESGSHTIAWDGKDDDGKKFAAGVYTYKIISKTSSTDTEIGYFIVGAVGEIDGEASSNDNDNNNDSSNNNSGNARCADFSDVLTSSTSCTAIVWARNAGIFQGYEDGTFKPFRAISRVEVLKVILRAVAIYVDESDLSSAGLGFSDVVNGKWYIAFIRGAKNLGIFAGDEGKGTARPTAEVSRAEVLKFAFESLRVAKGRQITTCTSSFSDVYGYNWFAKYACAAKTYSLFTTGTTLNPNIPATRGEVASVLYKLHTAGLL